MTLAAGSRLGGFELRERLGAGAMGEVWRARDTRLGRDVALKTLPEAFAADEQRRSRFEREAKLLAALSHPGIATLYGVEEVGGESLLVMELVEGEDLAARMQRGPLPGDEAAQIARQIAEALEAAHESGVVHRDLKPANIRLTADGAVKLLDFGLAKAMDSPGEGSGDVQSQSPTLSVSATAAGTLLGTPAYMAPEQVRGRVVDKRADIWAFGVVLYEMLSGQRAFEGETASDTLAAILRSEPDWSALPEATPPELRRLVRRCLEADARQRLRDVGEARIALGAIVADAGTAALPTRPRSGRAVAGLVAVAVVGGVVGWAVGQGAVPTSVPSPVSFAFQPGGFDPGLEKNSNVYGSLSVSPDGERLAFVGRAASGQTLLHVRRLSEVEAVALPGTEGAEQPVWSPRGDRIAFGARGGLFVVAAHGGPVERLVSEGTWTGYGLSWGRGGTLLLGDGVGGVLRVDESGGEPRLIEATAGFAQWPSFLPDGNHFFYLGERDPEVGSGGRHLSVYVSSLERPDVRQAVLPVRSRALYADGHVFFVRDSALRAQPFDPEALAATGESRLLVDDLEYFESHGGSAFSVSSGRLAYARNQPPVRLRLVDRLGRPVAEPAEPARFEEPVRISPDGGTAVAALEAPRSGTKDLFLIDLERGTSSRLTSEPSWEARAVWAPDGRSLAYASDSQGPPDLFLLELSGESKRPLWAAPGVQDALAWSPDGRVLLVRNGADGDRVWSLDPSSGREPGRLEPPTQADEALVSPDGRHLVFSSSESGRSEVYVQPFGRPGVRLRLSQSGGRRPRLRADGRELFYQAGPSLVAIPVAPGEPFEAGEPEVLFTSARPFSFQDATPDGQRFLILEGPPTGEWQTFEVVAGWQGLLAGPSASARP